MQRWLSIGRGLGADSFQRSSVDHEISSIDRASAISPDAFFDKIDKDKSGTITRDEFVQFHQHLKFSMHAEHKKEAALEQEAFRQQAAAASAKRRNKALCFVVVVLGLFGIILVVANASLTWTVVEASKETVAVGAGIMRVQGSEEIAKTAEATVKVPLIAAPMLPFDLLDNLKSVRVTRDDGVTARHGVTGYDWASNVSMTFRLASCGDLLVLHSGTATLRLASGAEHTVCAADATCSAFTVADSALDVDALLAAVTDALPKEDRRRSRILSGGCGAAAAAARPCASSPAITLPTATATTAALAPSTRPARTAPTAMTAGRVWCRTRRRRSPRPSRPRRRRRSTSTTFPSPRAAAASR